MRYYPFILTLMLLPHLLMAQKAVESKWSELEFLNDSRRLNLVIDYSTADILGEDFEDFVAGEAEWNSYEAEIRSKFIRAFNEEADDGPYPHRVGTYPDAEYTLVIHVKKVDDKGSNVKGVMNVLSINGMVLFTHEVEGNEGRFGSVCNLMGDAFREMGEDVGGKFYHHARMHKKKTTKSTYPSI